MKRITLTICANPQHQFNPVSPQLPGFVTVDDLNCVVSPVDIELNAKETFELVIETAVSIQAPQYQCLLINLGMHFFMAEDRRIASFVPVKPFGPKGTVPVTIGYSTSLIGHPIEITAPRIFPLQTLPLDEGQKEVDFVYRIQGVLLILPEEAETGVGYSIPFSFDPKMKITTGGSGLPGGDGKGSY